MRARGVLQNASVVGQHAGCCCTAGLLTLLPHVAPPPPLPQDCPDSGVLWAETINMAPRPQRKTRSGGCQAAEQLQGAAAQGRATPPQLPAQGTSVFTLRSSLIGPVIGHCALLNFIFPLPLPTDTVDALKKCNDDPHVVAAVASLFWCAGPCFWTCLLDGVACCLGWLVQEMGGPFQASGSPAAPSSSLGHMPVSLPAASNHAPEPRKPQARAQNRQGTVMVQPWSHFEPRCGCGCMRWSVRLCNVR